MVLFQGGIIRTVPDHAEKRSAFRNLSAWESLFVGGRQRTSCGGKAIAAITPETVPAGLAMTLFGPMAVIVQGRPLPRLRSRRALWLLALLTLRHERPVEREWLAGTLWPDADQSQAFANLRVVLSELRQALDDQGERVQSPSRHTLLLNLAGAEVDVLAFDAAVKSGTLPALERAVALYQGPLLEGCTEEWAPQERLAREQACLSALQKLADAATAAGDHRGAAVYWRRAVGIDPLSDGARRGLMGALAQSGDANGALQVYRAFVELLRSDPKAAPDKSTTELYARLRTEARERAGAPVAAVPATDVAVPTAPVVTGYLPHPMTELVGREDECLEVAARLRRVRLLTLTGLGGIGKTRLAMEVAGQVAREYADGVWFVALEGLSTADGKQVAGRIASVLGVREEPGRTPLESLTNHLRTRQLLLVLDNCEHLLEATAQAAGHLLRECPGLRTLATSREPLGISGETAWTVPSLAVPDPAHLPAGPATLLRVLMGYEGVRLFVERAQAVQQSFSLSGDNALAVAQICSHLDGIPLALELTAARVRAMTVGQIAERLPDHLNLATGLTGRARTALSRQQTLRAMLDWSHDLLGDAERLLLARLSVFAGGWTLEAAEKVSTGNGIESETVLDLLTSLVDKSLVVFEEQDSVLDGRYRLLEIVRQYAAERLEASGQTDRVRAGHRNWLAALAAAAEPQLTGPEQGAWLRQLDAEHDNLRATLAWDGAEAQGAASDLWLAGALYRFWYVRGYVSEGRDHLARVLGREAAQGRTAERAKALNEAGDLAHRQGDYASARTLLDESLSLRRELGDKQGIAWSLNLLGNVAYDQGDYASARVLHEESLGLCRELGDRLGIAWSLNSLGNIVHPQGEYTTAQALYEESLNLFREAGDHQGVARSLSCLGYVAFDQGQYATARSLHEESLNIARDLGDRGGIAWALCCLGYLDYILDSYTSARVLLEEGLDHFQALGDRRGVAWALNSLGNVAQALGEFETARTFHQESLDIRSELGDRQGAAWSLLCLGNLAQSQEAYAAARARIGESLRLFRDLRDRKGVAECLDGLAAVLQGLGRVQEAVCLWGAAWALRESIGSPLSLKEREKHDRQTGQARVTIGENAFVAVWEEGRALTWEQAASFAVGETDRGAMRP
jgi:predicted ATPase/DNA-binding SARP family transcriptional activator